MQWYEDQAYVAWQRRDGTHSEHLDRAIEYAKRHVESSGSPQKSENEVVSAAVQLNSEYRTWVQSMAIERHRCAVYTEKIAMLSMGAIRDDSSEEDVKRLKATAGVALRVSTDFQQGKHWSNVWKEKEPEDSPEQAQADE